MHGALVRPPSNPEPAECPASFRNSSSHSKQIPGHNRFQISRPNGLRRALIRSLCFVVLVALSGCGGIILANGGGTEALVASPTTVTFGAVSIGQTASTTVSLLNGSSAPVEIDQLSLTGQSFSLAGPSTLPITIGAGGTYDLNVQFDPTAAGAATGQLTIASNSSTNAKLVISLSGTGMAATPAAALSALFSSNASIAGSGTDACSVTLTAAAPSGGLSVSLSSTNAAVTVPASVTVPANATTAGFTATVSSVATAEAVT